jgi:hypothetical protein
MADFDKRLIPNYIFAGMFFSVFLFGCVYALVNWQTLGGEIETLSAGEALVLGGVGGSLITALIVIVKDWAQFFTRTTPSTN